MARRKCILILSVLVALLPAGGAHAQQCSVSDGESIVQGLLDDVIAPFNSAWPAICEATGLDPFDNVYDGSVNLGCGLGDLGHTICGLEASSCKSMWADVDVSQITGLENLALTAITVTSTDAGSGTTCPYKSSAVDDTSFSCSYSGEGTATAAVTGTLTADLSNIEIRVECDALGGLDKFKETIWQGHATATATGGTATADVKYCSGVCSVDSGLASLVYLASSDLKLKLTGVSTKIVTDGSSYDIDAQLADEIADTIADELKSVLEAAIAPTVSEALNDEVDEILPLPSSCSSANATAPATLTDPGVAAAATAPAPDGALVCWDAGRTAGSPPFTSINDLPFTDARQSTRDAIVRQAQVCRSAAGDAPSGDFVGYVLRPEFDSPAPVLPSAVLRNQFGVQRVGFGQVLPDVLLSAADDEGALDVGCILAPGAYRCTAAVGDGADAQQQVQVQVTDGPQPLTLRLQGVRSVCAPLRFDGASVLNAGWLACYQTAPVTLAPLPAPVDVISAFGSQVLGPLGADRRLCVPTEVVFATAAPSVPRLGIGGGGRPTGGVGFVGSGASCPLVRSHLDPGLGVFERSTIVNVK